jgi:hypothetical protein
VRQAASSSPSRSAPRRVIQLPEFELALIGDANFPLCVYRTPFLPHSRSISSDALIIPPWS